MSDQPCTCIGVKDAVHLALTDQQQPACPQHDMDRGTSSAPLALNDNAGLAARLGVTLNASENNSWT